ncbi:hypothetical protein [Mycolicibacterium neworleansense]|nr:hypothetical protein [Mycolicibacterium neworleansense]MCV7363855.1 hypothetical protein [Mycolicibacterium neworleansense]
MATFEAEINALDFAAIDSALTRARNAFEQAQQLSVADLDPTVLLGDLGSALTAAGAVKLDPAVVNDLGGQALQALSELIDLPDLRGIAEIVGGFEVTTERLIVLAEAFGGGGDGAVVLDRIFAALGGSLNLETMLREITDQAAHTLQIDIPDEFTGPLQALSALAGDPDPAELLDILGTVLTGLDLAAVQQLLNGAERALTLVTGAGDAGPLQAAVTAVGVRLDAGYALMAAPAPDVPALLAIIDEVGAAVDAVAVAMPGFAAGLATDLRTAANALPDLNLAASLDRLAAALPLPGEDIPRQLVESLDGMADALEQLTPDAVTAAMAAMKDELLAASGLDRLDDLLSELDRGFDEAAKVLDRLPVRGLRDDAVAAVVAAQQKVLTFDGFGFLDEAVAPIRELNATIASLDPSTVTGGIAAVVAQVNGLLTDIDVAPIRDAVDAVIEPLGDIVDRLVPFVQEIAAQLARIVDQLNGIDFDAAGTATLDLLHGIRNQVVEAVGGGDVPEPVKVAVATAAAVLREMNIAAEISTPFDKAVLAIDVGALIAPVEGIWQVAGDALAKATPSALIAELDPPYEELAAAVDRLSLQPLIDAAQRLFDDVIAQLDRADPRTLIAPLEDRFQDLIDGLTAALDPAPLFAPMRAAYQALRDLLDRIDIAATLRAALGGLADMPHQMSSRLGQRLASGVSGAAPAPVAGDGFQLGDVLRPLALFLGEVRDRLADLAGDALEPALAGLATATRGLRALTDPATGFAVQLGDALDARLTWLDPNAGDGPLARLRRDLESFRLAVAVLDVDAAAGVQLNTAAGNVQFDTRVSAATDTDVAQHAARLRQTSDSATLGRSIRVLARALDAALPDELVSGSLDPTTATAAFLDAVFDRIDPSTLADQLDAIGARIEARFVALGDELANGLFKLVDGLFAGIEPLMPESVIGRLQAGLDRVLASVEVLDPAAVEDAVRGVIRAAISLLGLHSPAALAAELGHVFDTCIAQLRSLSPAALFAGADPFVPIKAQLATMRPSAVLAPLVDKTESFGTALDTIAAIDLQFALGVVDELRQTFTAVLDGVEREWKALLDELSRISEGASVSVSVG